MRKLIGIIILLVLISPVYGQEGTTAKEAPDVRRLLISGKYQEALNICKEILQANPRDIEARLELAYIYDETGKYDEAQVEYEAIIKAESGNLDAKLGLAELLFYRGQYQKTSQIITQIIKDKPDNLRARLIKAQLAEETGQYDQIIRILKGFTVVKPEEKPLKSDEFFALVQGLWLYANRQGAKDIFHRVNGQLLPLLEEQEKRTKHFRLGADLYVFWGNCYLAKGDMPQAIDCFRDALKINPSHPGALVGQASLNMRSNPKGALPIIQKVLDINPNFIEARELLVWMHLFEQSSEDALDEVNKALEINPNSVNLRGTRAGLYYLDNSTEDVEREVKVVTKINPRPAVFYYVIGQMCRMGYMLYEESLPFYERAVKLDPEFGDAQIALGMNLMQLGAEAEPRGHKILDEAFERDPFNVRVYNTLKVLDALEEEFETVQSAHFQIKMHKTERELLEPYVIELLEIWYDKLTELYQFEPAQPLLFELFPSPKDFTVRMMGVTGSGYLGVCFARTFLALGHQAQDRLGRYFHWGSVVLHEFTHVITLQMSKFRVPRWFTEGCSVYAEKLAGWDRELEMEIYNAYQAGKLKRLDQFAQRRGFDLLHTYLFSSIIIEYIHKTYGMDTINKMLKEFGERKSQDNVFQECLGKTLKEFDDEFFDYFENQWLGQFKIRRGVKLSKEKELKERLAKNAEDAEALAQLARISYQKDNLLEAEDYARRSLEIDAKNIEALLVMANSLFKKRGFKQSLKYFNRAIQAGADDFGTYFKLGKIHFRAKKLPKAIEYFQKAKQAFPKYVEKENNPYYYLMEIYEEDDEPDKAIEQLEQLLKIDHEDFAGRMKLAKVYRQRGKHEDLVSFLKETIYLDPEDIKLHVWLAEAYKKTGKQDEALRSYQHALLLLGRLEPGEKQQRVMSNIYCHQAEICLSRDEKAEARKILLKAQEIAPFNKRVEDLLEKCGSEKK